MPLLLNMQLKAAIGSRAGLIAAVCILTASRARSDTSILQSIDWVSQPGRAQLTLQLSRQVRFSGGRLTGPDRVYVDLIDVSAARDVAVPAVPAQDTAIKQIRIGNPGADILRVVVDLKLPADFSIVQIKESSRLLLILRPSLPPLVTNGVAPAGLSKPPGIVLQPAPGLHSPLPQGLVYPELANSAPIPEPSLPPAPAAPVEAPTVIAPAEPPAVIAPAKPPAVIAPAKPAAAPPAPLAVESPRKLSIPRASHPPKLEDFLHGVPSRESRVEGSVSDFRQREPVDGAPVSQPTTAFLSYDDQNLYVIFVCKEERGKVRGRMAKREDIGGDDQVSVYLDTFHDNHRSYAFSVNPLGVQRDSVITEGQSEDSSFDTLWRSEGRITEDGFVTLMAIPFKSLRFPRTQAQTWGIALGRSFVHNNDRSFWPAITLRSQGFVQQFGALEGLEGISGGRNLQFIPYVTGAQARTLDYGKAGYVRDHDIRGGLDSKIVLRDAFSFDLALNPDFSQVESDDPQVTINQRYEVYFPEKRPFFLENAGFFQTPVNLFFSRRIIDPEFGARLTGKADRWAVALLAADDRAPGRALSASDPDHGERAEVGLVRVQREFGEQSMIGLFASTRQFGSSYNNVFSLDTRLRLNKTWSFTGQAIESFTRGRDAKHYSGAGYQASLARSGQHFSSTTSYADRAPNFRSDLGFIQRVDVRQFDQSFGYFFRPEKKSSLVGWGPSVSGGINYDRKGRLQDWYGGLNLGVYLKGPSGFTISHYKYYTLYLNQGLSTQRSDASYFTSALKWLDISSSLGFGTGVNFNPGPGLVPFTGRSVDATFSVTLRPTPRLRWDNLYYYNWLKSTRSSVFNNHISRSKLNYQFTRALSARFIVDYYGTLTNPELIYQNTYKRLFGDFLITYQLNSGTAIYIGYTNRFENVLLENSPIRRVLPASFPQTSTASQIFIKLNYLLRY